MNRARSRLRDGLPCAAALAAGMVLAHATPARALDICETADRLAAVEIASYEFHGEVRPDIGRVVSRMSWVLDQTNWLAGLSELSPTAQGAAETAIDTFVESRRRLVAAYRNAGVQGARSVMDSDGYVHLASVVAVLEDLSDCAFDTESKAGGLLSTQPSANGDGNGPRGVFGDRSAGLLAVNILLVIIVLLLAWRFEGYVGRRNRQYACACQTTLSAGGDTWDVTVISLGMRRARLTLKTALATDDRIDLLLDGQWHPGRIVSVTPGQAVVAFDPALPFGTVTQSCLVGDTAEEAVP